MQFRAYFFEYVNAKNYSEYKLSNEESSYTFTIFAVFLLIFQVSVDSCSRADF